MGGVLRSRSGEPVSRPTAEDPHKSPSQFDGGAWGAQWDDWRTGCPPHGRRSVAADVPARLAQRLQRNRPITSSGGLRPDVPPKAAGERLARQGRAAASTSMNLDFPAARLRAWRVHGVAFRDKRAPSEATCERGPIAKRASVMRSMTDRSPRSPGTERAATCLSRLCRPDRVASGWKPVKGRDAPVPRWLDAARQPARARGDAQPTGTWQQWHLGAHRRIQRLPLLDQLIPGKQWSLPPASNLGDDLAFNETFTPATLACR